MYDTPISGEFAATFYANFLDKDVWPADDPATSANFKPLPVALQSALELTEKSHPREQGFLDELLLLFRENDGFELLRRELLPQLLNNLLANPAEFDFHNFQLDPTVYAIVSKEWQKLITAHLRPILEPFGLDGLLRPATTETFEAFEPATLVTLWAKLTDPSLNSLSEELLRNLPAVFAEQLEQTKRNDFLAAMLRTESTHLPLVQTAKEVHSGLAPFYSKDSYIGYTLHERAKRYSRKLVQELATILPRRLSKLTANLQQAQVIATEIAAEAPLLLNVLYTIRTKLVEKINDSHEVVDDGSDESEILLAMQTKAPLTKELLWKMPDEELIQNIFALPRYAKFESILTKNVYGYSESLHNNYLPSVGGYLYNYFLDVQGRFRGTNSTLSSSINTAFMTAAKRVLGIEGVDKAKVKQLLNKLSIHGLTSISQNPDLVLEAAELISQQHKHFASKLASPNEITPPKSMCAEVCWANIAETLLLQLGPSSIFETTANTLVLQLGDACIEIPIDARQARRMPICESAEINHLYDVVSYLALQPNQLKQIYQFLGCPEIVLKPTQSFTMAEEILFFFEAATANPVPASIEQYLIPILYNQLFPKGTYLPRELILPLLEQGIALHESEANNKELLAAALNALYQIYGCKNILNNGQQQELLQLNAASRSLKPTEKDRLQLKAFFVGETSLFQQKLPAPILAILENTSQSLSHRLSQILRILRAMLMSPLPRKLETLSLVQMEKFTNLNLRKGTLADNIYLFDGKIYTGADLCRHLFTSNIEQVVQDEKGNSTTIYYAEELIVDDTRYVYGFCDKFKTQMVIYEQNSRYSSIKNLLYASSYGLAELLAYKGGVLLARRDDPISKRSAETLFGNGRPKCAATSALHHFNAELMRHLSPFLEENINALLMGARLKGITPVATLEMLNASGTALAVGFDLERGVSEA
jgi:hypothetical protein